MELVEGKAKAAEKEEMVETASKGHKPSNWTSAGLFCQMPSLVICLNWLMAWSLAIAAVGDRTTRGHLALLTRPREVLLLRH